MKIIITENQYLSLALRRRIDDLMRYVRSSVPYTFPCDYNRDSFVYSVAWNVGDRFSDEGFGLSNVRQWVEDNMAGELLKYWDEKCGNKRKPKSRIFSEGKMDNLIVDYLNINLYPDYNWEPHASDLYRQDLERVGFFDFKVNDLPGYSYVGEKGGFSGFDPKTLMIEPDVWKTLDNYFGDRWESVFVKWFEDNTGLPVEHLEKYGGGE